VPRSCVRLLTLAVVVVACAGPAPSGPLASVASDGPTVAPASPTVAPTGTPVARPSESPSSPPPQVGVAEPWIAFQTLSAGGYGVHLVRPDGSGFHKWPVDIMGTHEHPDWSPDGSTILLNSVMPDGTEDLWTAPAEGGDGRLLLDCVDPCLWVDEAAWAPDGSRIAFQRLVRRDDGGLVSTLELLDVGTGATSIVLTMPRQQVVLQPRWSPDGRRLVVEVIHLPADSLDVDPDWGAIGTVDLEADEPVVRLVTDMDGSNSPDWSADGDHLVLSRPTETGADLWRIAPDGSDALRLTDLAATGGFAEQPAFLPDGGGVLFAWTAGEDGRRRIGRVEVDGGQAVNATGDLELDGAHPRARPLRE
jgi:Tol biopolymer transport system component